VARYLVTGGAGFIGSHVARALLDQGHEVVIVDNLSTGLASNLPPTAQFIHADLTDPATIKLLPVGQYAAVIHIAGQSSGAIGQKSPYADLQANVGSTMLLAQWCATQGIRRFLYASSMAVYGLGNREPRDEDWQCQPISYYGSSKFASETYLRATLADGLEPICLRLYNVYGAGQNLGNLYQGMASIYLAYLLAGGPVPVTGSLDRYRDFVHVDDVVAAFLAALHAPYPSSMIFNIGTGRRTTVQEILALLIKLMDLPPDHPIHTSANTPGDVFGSVANVERARRELQWEAGTRLEDGLKTMVDWARQVRALKP